MRKRKTYRLAIVVTILLLPLLSLRPVLSLFDTLKHLPRSAFWRVSVDLVETELSDHSFKYVNSFLLEVILVVVNPAKESGDKGVEMGSDETSRQGNG
jgi:hypothetical protein